MYNNENLNGKNAIIEHPVHGYITGVIVRNSTPAHATGAWTIDVYVESLNMVMGIPYHMAMIVHGLSYVERCANLEAAHRHYSAHMEQYPIWAERIANGYRFW